MRKNENNRDVFVLDGKYELSCLYAAARLLDRYVDKTIPTLDTDFSLEDLVAFERECLETRGEIDAALYELDDAIIKKIGDLLSIKDGE